MARIFNIYFVFNEQMYNAVVSVRTTPFFTEYSLSHFNEDLLNLLPGNKIISKPSGNFHFQNSTPQHSSELMNAIITAVKEHLHLVNS